ncbi:MAG: NADH-quinone oxidoreductase subunit NuoK [Campylobacterales bacterium]|nr:NADH-quinone oxidoreductase subunit NuoK [Campylobacterales bacterium]
MSPLHFLLLGTLLFGIGLVGVIARRNLFVVYMSIELMLSAVNLLLATFSRIRGDEGGAVLSLLLIAVIAAEAAIFLAMIIALFRAKRSIDAHDFTQLSQEHNA